MSPTIVSEWSVSEIGAAESPSDVSAGLLVSLSTSQLSRLSFVLFSVCVLCRACVYCVCVMGLTVCFLFR